MKARVWRTVVLLALAPACRFEFDAEGTACDATGSCPQGYVCSAARICRRELADGGPGGGAAADSGTAGGGSSDAGCPCADPACAGTVCRPVVGPCDEPERCTALACPPDGAKDAGAFCAAASCGDGARLPASVCSAAGVCQTGSPVSCGTFACNAADAGCFSRCTTSAECASGFFCSMGSCAPRRQLAAACASADECASGVCASGVCCATACTGGCAVCNASASRGICTVLEAMQPGQPACDGGFLCDGTSADCPSTCSGSADCVQGSFCESGRCVPRRGNGVACTAHLQCSSGFCVDGVCCNTACANGCDTCAGPTSGVCTVRPAGSPGAEPSCAPFLCNGVDAGCPTTCASGADCAGDAGCSALNRCEGKAGNGQGCQAASDCLSNLCVDGVCCNSPCAGPCDRCDAIGSRGLCTPTPGATGACGLFLCGAAASCPTACGSSADCAPTAFCGSGAQCVAKRDAGVACTLGVECASGFCVEGDGGTNSGVCCSSACGGACQACRLSGQEGQCRNSPGGSDPRGACGSFTCSGTAPDCPTSCGPRCGTGCKANAFCDGARCVPRLASGSPCQDCECRDADGCRAAYDDSDGDGVGGAARGTVCAPEDAGLASRSGDCCEADSRVFPGQQQYFPTRRSASCAGPVFDYDCDGAESMRWMERGLACQQAAIDGCFTECRPSPSGTTTPGWDDLVPPACGTAHAWIGPTCTTVGAPPVSQCTGGESMCVNDGETRTQACR